MSNLINLSKIHQQKLNELRVELKKTNEQKDQLLEVQRMQEEDFTKEKAFISTNPEFMTNFDKYQERYEIHKANLDSAMENIKVKLDKIENSINDHFISQKKYDLLIERNRLEQIEKEKKQEEKELDELALRNHE